MATIKFQIRSKVMKLVPIYVRVSISKEILLRTKTNFHIQTSDWSKVKGLPKQNKAENKQLASNLSKLQAYLEHSINEAGAKGDIIDKPFLEQKIASCFNRRSNNERELVRYQVKQIIENAHTRRVRQSGKIGLSENTIKNYKTFLKKWEDFESYMNREIRFSDLSINLSEKFKEWLLNERHYSVNTAGKDVACLSQLATEAAMKEINVNSQASFIRGFAQKNEDRYIVTFSHEELDQIKKTEFDSSKMRTAMNWLLLGCELGQRGGDLLQIKEKDIRPVGNERVIDVFQEKTKKRVVVPVTKRAMTVLKDGLPQRMTEQEFNRLLKVLVKSAGFIEEVEGYRATVINKKGERRNVFGRYPRFELVSSHCCRRSFATNYYGKIATNIIMSITGHSKESTFLKYINKQSDKDENALQFLKNLNQ